MVLEHAQFTVAPADAEAFEAAFDRARAFVARAAGFRQSDLYTEWSALLRPFYAAPPVVDHLEAVAEG